MLKVIVLATLTAAVAQGTPLLLTALGEILTQQMCIRDRSCSVFKERYR